MKRQRVISGEDRSRLAHDDVRIIEKVEDLCLKDRSNSTR